MAKQPTAKMTSIERLDYYTQTESNSGCWLWTGPVARGGYGVLNIKRTQVRAHRVQWERFNGPIPEGMLICHHCDITSCVNPDHLFLGTHKDNVYDCMAKGRRAKYVPWNRKGENNGQAILTENQVRGIRKDARKIKDIARNYLVSAAAIYKVKDRRTWPHVDP